MNTQDYLDLYKKDLEADRCTPRTVETNLYYLGKMAALYPDVLPQSPKDIRQILRANSNFATSTAQALHSRLRAFWNWLLREGYVTENPVLKVPSPRGKPELPQTLTDDECTRLLAAPRNKRDHAMIALLLDTGIRVGELHSMERQHLTPSRFQVHGKNGDRLVPISPGVYEMVAGQCRGKGRYVWMSRQKKRLELRSIQRIISTCMKDAGIQGPQLGAQRIRHSFGIWWGSDRGDLRALQKILGHSTPTMTLRYGDMAMPTTIEEHRKRSRMKDFAAHGKPDVTPRNIEALRAAGQKSGQVRRAQREQRRQQALDMLAAGLPQQDVANDIGVDVRTIKTYKADDERGLDNGNLH